MATRRALPCAPLRGPSCALDASALSVLRFLGVPIMRLHAACQSLTTAPASRARPFLAVQAEVEETRFATCNQRIS